MTRARGMLWILLLLIGLVTLLYLFQDRMIYYPRRYSAADLALAGSRVTPIRFRTAEGNQTRFMSARTRPAGRFPEESGSCSEGTPRWRSTGGLR